MRTVSSSFTQAPNAGGTIRVLCDLFRDSDGHFYETVSAIFLRVFLWLLPAALVIWALALGLRALLARAWPDAPLVRRLTRRDAPQRRGTYAITIRGILCACVGVAAVCAVSFLVCLLLRRAAPPSMRGTYRVMAIRFASAAVLQSLGGWLALRWLAVKDVESVIRYTIIPAIYKTLRSAMSPAEADRAFCIAMPIIDRYIGGSALRSLIQIAYSQNSQDGAAYLRIVLDVVYSPDATEAGAPYTALFSEQEKRAMDLIKLRVFRYPSMDSPWQPCSAPGRSP